MKIYKVERTDAAGWDEYDAFVVVAENGEAARNMHPGGELSKHNPYDGTWPVRLDALVVTEIGEAATDAKPGIVLASFNAG